MVIGPADKDLSWIKEAYNNLEKLGITPKALPTPESIRAHFAERGLADAVGAFHNKTGYFNPAAGWSEATRAIQIGHKRIQKLGGTIEGGKEVAGLVADGKKVTGVRLVGGETIEADHVIVATGAWCVRSQAHHLLDPARKTDPRLPRPPPNRAGRPPSSTRLRCSARRSSPLPASRSASGYCPTQSAPFMIRCRSSGCVFLTPAACSCLRQLTDGLSPTQDFEGELRGVLARLSLSW
jgi:glycine/D-amino acid oxidase-like deaminating enzyme